ncbi:hypothetical protein KKB83_00715 [Patescibacteria group bacterium]|nr:hypothetical protein [Patescibacteria group bacterium]
MNRSRLAKAFREFVAIAGPIWLAFAIMGASLYGGLTGLSLATGGFHLSGGLHGLGTIALALFSWRLGKASKFRLSLAIGLAVSAVIAVLPWGSWLLR